MVEWNGIFRVFRFSGVLGQPREVRPKFRNEIPKMTVPFTPQPGISGIFGRMESAHIQLPVMIAFPLAETNCSLSAIDIEFQCLFIYIADNIK